MLSLPLFETSMKRQLFKLVYAIYCDTIISIYIIILFQYTCAESCDIPFTLDPNTGELELAVHLDYESSPLVNFTAQASGTCIYYCTIITTLPALLVLIITVFLRTTQSALVYIYWYFLYRCLPTE